MSENKSTKEILEEICEFPISSYDMWRSVAEKSLKGASFEKLLTHTYEGITLKPMYRQEDVKDMPHLSSLPGKAPYVRGTKAIMNEEKPWEISQEINELVPENFNEAVQHDIERGQTAMNMILNKATLEGFDIDELTDGEASGVSISSISDIRQALAKMDLTKIPLHVQTGAVSLPFYSLMMCYAKEKGVPLHSIRGSITADPIGFLVKNGHIMFSMEKCFNKMAQVTVWALEHTPHIQTIGIEGHPYHDGGGSAVEELAFSLATAVEYVQAMLERGLQINEITRNIRFSFSIGSNMFMEIGKLRAARLLWSTIVEAYGGSREAQKMTLHGRTSSWTKTVYDPYVNMLRGTVEAFTGAVGGVDSMHVSPFDEPIQGAASFSRRIARNTQLILQEEAHLSKQIDPGGGSWYVEFLTDSLAKKAWELFQQVESKGGMLEALKEGFPQQTITKTSEAKAKNIEHRKDIFVGTNMYPNEEEKPILRESENMKVQWERCKASVRVHRTSRKFTGKIENITTVDEVIDVMKQGGTIGEVAKRLGREENPKLTIKPILAERGAERFEDLRRKSDVQFMTTGKRLRVFLANIGPIPNHKARADFSTSFFEVGGFEVIRNNGFESADDAASAAVESKAEIVVISGTDDDYPDVVPVIAKIIMKARQGTTVFLAGKPPTELKQEFIKSGVHDFLHLGSNCYEVLSKLQSEKGVVSS
ncbi:methylmalonyl-CoA mutase family protein [Evansella sp. AB-rgal1]|uniref:methylmalonyl-CoA mutase family protein n=1 Tax=Evansella sp. AB-rgal1 TaxID=3242696 RepID=UPI00359EA3E7